MKIALLGYGKMGKKIAAFAENRNHELVYILDKKQQEGSLEKADVAINFSVPEAAVDNIKMALEHGVPVVCGTTGWLDDYEKVVSFCTEKDTAFLYASNFSIGVNLFFKINQYVAKLLRPHLKDYRADIKEIHHIHKQDAPSGTAISLAEDIIKHTHYEHWTQDEFSKNNLTISSERSGEVPGTHSVEYRSDIDQITLKHEAFKRDGFALGAVIAAEWIVGKKGIYMMEDVLKIS